MKHQIILLHGYPVVKEVIQSVHKELLHAGPESTLSVLRQANWLTKARRKVKRVLGKCLVCQRQHVGPRSQKMAPLPSEWVSSSSAFTHVGIDFAESHLNKGLHLHFQVRLFWYYSPMHCTIMHCTENNKNDWRAEWGYQALFSCCTSKKAGVAILFKNNFTFQISKTYSDPEGRFIICDLTVNGKQLTLTNIYAPNNDDSNFLTSVLSHLADFKCDEIMIGGDFNLVLDVKKIKGVTLQEFIKDHWKLSIAPLKR